MKQFLPLFFLALIPATHATNPSSAPERPLCNLPWYVSIDTGYAWSRETGISPNLSVWDAANQGYNATVGNRGFISLGLGKEVTEYINIDVDYTKYATFNYQKYQTGLSSTPGFTGDARTRFFDLNHQSILVNLNFHPVSTTFAIDNIAIFPFVSVGAGFGSSRVSDFHTVAYSATSGVGSTTSIGQDNTENSFAWQASLGLTFAPKHNFFKFDLGYRYYDGGRFHGPNRIVGNVPASSGGQVSVSQWSGRFRTDQVFAVIRFLF